MQHHFYDCVVRVEALLLLLLAPLACDAQVLPVLWTHAVGVLNRAAASIPLHVVSCAFVPQHTDRHRHIMLFTCAQCSTAFGRLTHAA
jgi:hypothetical protein